MKIAILILLFAHAALFGFAQNFTLQDTDFQVGDTLRKTIIFSMDYPRIMPDSYPFMDSLLIFLSLHDSLYIKIEANTDIRGHYEFNDTISDRRAKAVKNYLVCYGINETRLSTFGNGEKEPIISEEEINQMETNEEREKAHALNRQTVFRIIEIR